MQYNLSCFCIQESIKYFPEHFVFSFNENYTINFICCLKFDFLYCRFPSCYQLGKTNTKIPTLLPGDHEITINPLYDFGNSMSKFILNEKNVCKYLKRKLI